MKIIADTNVLVRAATQDDPVQGKLAAELLTNAELVAVTAPALCEYVWVLSQGYKIPTVDIAASIRKLVASANVAADQRAVAAGLAHMAEGGDFADGVIAHDGAWLGGETFVSFDKAAVRRINAQGGDARLPA